jgi:hypothetical protein
VGASLTGKRISLRSPGPVFVLSLIFSVVLMFNQQVVTAVSLQPVHYQVFVGNYVAALALLVAIRILAGSLLLPERSVWRTATLALAGAAVIWGAVECQYNSTVLDATNIRLDASMPVAGRLGDAAAADPAMANTTVLSYDLLLADKLPSAAPQNVLWARHQAVFSSLSKEESDRRFFCYLYYLKIDGLQLDRLLRGDQVTITALFGWDRHTDRLSVDARPLTEAEIRVAVARFDRFRAGFSIVEAAEPQLSFVVVPQGDVIDLANLRKWYDLGDGEPVGSSVLYRPKLRGQIGTPAS